MRRAALLVVFLATAAAGVIMVTSQVSKALHAQPYQIDGWAIKKSWGPVRGVYLDRRGELRMVFEDATGTVRVATVDPETGTAVPFGREMRRQ